MNIIYNIIEEDKISEKKYLQYSENIELILKSFGDSLTKIEVFFKDEEGKQAGQLVRCCVLRAKFLQRKSVTVVSRSSTYNLAVKKALEKMQSSLTRVNTNATVLE